MVNVFLASFCRQIDDQYSLAKNENILKKIDKQLLLLAPAKENDMRQVFQEPT